MENKELLKDTAEKMGVVLTEDMLEKFMVYKDMLLEWNEKINLTAITDEKEIMIKHFADCISIGKHVKFKDGEKVIDVGTGAGFPGVPIKIAFPNIKITLLDSLNKRINFLNELSSSLGLKDVECVHSRAEDGGQNTLYREQFDCCISRAVANLAVLSEYCLPFVKVGGYFISLKGPDATEEIDGAQAAVKKLGGKIEETIKIEIPNSDITHSLVMIKKIAPTPKQYPRKAGTATKKPIK